jgi:hypothetical protein
MVPEPLRFWRDWRQPQIDLFGPMPFSAVETISNDPVDPIPGSTTTEWLRALDPEAIDTIMDHAFTVGGPPPVMFLEVRHTGGAVSRGEPDAAYGNRDASLLLEAVGATPTPEAKEALHAHLARLRERLRPHTTGGAYLNFLTGAQKGARPHEGLTEEDYRRLQALKRQYDPQNLFRYGLDLMGG